MKKLIAASLAAVMLITSLFTVSVFGTSVSINDMVKAAEDIIGVNEGPFDSVSANDNGALSIGRLQWHGNRALNLLKTIVSADPATAKNLLGTALYNEIVSSSNWSTRILTSAEAANMKKLMATNASKKAQDELAYNDVSAYINHGMALGITSPSTLVYFADIENQCGAGGSARVADAAKEKAGSYEKITLDIFYKASREDKISGRPEFLGRRDRAYSACLLLGWDSISGNYEVWSADTYTNIRSGAGTSYPAVGGLGAGSATVIYEKFAVGNALWGRCSTGWLCLDYSSYRLGNIPTPVIFDLCGGKASAASSSITVNGVNTIRGSAQIIVYNNDNANKTTCTNMYGTEAIVDSTGRVTNATKWGVCNSKIPDGGFVVSGHEVNAAAVLNTVVKEGTYVYFDRAAMTLRVFANRNDYLLAAKSTTAGKAVGDLPAAQKSGYVFDGWYTAESGGDKVTGSTVYSKHTPLKLFARWRTASASIVFSMEGGTFDGCETASIDGINTGRGPEALILYNSDFPGGYTKTNEYGGEVIVNAAGTVIQTARWGICNSKIPEGGFVLSAHNTRSYWLNQHIQLGNYVTYDNIDNTITIYKDKATYDAINKNVTVGKPIGKLPAAKKEHYDFKGWYTGEGTLVTENTYVPYGGIVLYARWEIRPSKITLNANGGTLPSPVSAKLNGTNTNRYADQLILYKNTASTKTNIYGTEVLIDKNGKVLDVLGYGNGNLAVPSGCSVLSGHGKMMTWLDKNVHIGSYIIISGSNVTVYDSYGSYLYSKERKLTYGSAYGELPTPVRPGYKFTGWTDNDGKSVSGGSIVDRYDDITLTAQWINTVTITFNANGGSLSHLAKSASAAKLNGQRLADELIIYTGCSTTGTNPYGTEVIVDSSGYVSNVYFYTGNHAVPESGYVISGHGKMSDWLLANVKKGSYVRVIGKKVTVANSKEEYEAASGKITVGKSQPLTMLPTPEKSQSYFTGWYTPVNTVVSAGGWFSADITLTARWKTASAPANYKLNGGKFEAATAKLLGVNAPQRLANALVLYNNKASTNTNNYGIEAIISAEGKILTILPWGVGNTAIPAGCSVLSGHGTMADWMMANLRTDKYIKVVGNTVYVYNSKDAYDIQYNKTLRVNTPYGALPQPTKAGYFFVGWQNYAGNLVYADTTVQSCDDPTLDAVWKKADTLTLSVDGTFKFESAQTKVSGYNTARLANNLIVYTGTRTGTNIYGTEVLVGEDGYVKEVYFYTGNHEVPKNGYILSGHGTMSDWLLANVKKGNYIDVRSGNVIVYTSKTEHLAKYSVIYTAQNGTVPALPTPVKAGSVFDGWFTSDGRRVKEGDASPSDGTKLFARWK